MVEPRLESDLAGGHGIELVAGLAQGGLETRDADF
jgi:hypothetical protein